MMEILGLFEIPIWLMAIPCVCFCLYLYGVWPYKKWENLGVAGPPASAFFGHMSELYDSKTSFADTCEKWRRRYGGIYGIYYFRRPTLVVTNLEILKQVLVKDFNNFVDRYIAGDGYLEQRIIKKGVFFAEGIDWQRMRRIMTPMFTSGKLRLLTHHMNNTAKRLADSLEKSAEGGINPDAKQVFSAFTLDVIAGTAFGLDLDCQANPENPFMSQAKELVTFKKTFQYLLAMAEIFPVLGSLLKLFKMGIFKKSAVQYFEEQMYLHIDERKKHPEQYKQLDFIQLLLNTESSEDDEIIGSRNLSLEEVAAQGIIFVLAGYETSSTALQYLFYELARNRDVQNKLVAEIQQILANDEEPNYENCQELKYTEAVINETLRMYPPLHLISRKCVKATTLNGISLPENTPILIPISVIGRIPEYFDDPDTFIPDRFLGENKQKMEAVSFLPFGFGPRQCIGLRIAMLQLKIALVHVLRKVSVVNATPKNLDFEDFAGILVPKEKIKLVLKSKMLEED